MLFYAFPHQESDCVGGEVEDVEGQPEHKEDGPNHHQKVLK